VKLRALAFVGRRFEQSAIVLDVFPNDEGKHGVLSSHLLLNRSASLASGLR
jgi:hypothetical protein